MRVESRCSEPCEGKKRRRAQGYRCHAARGATVLARRPQRPPPPASTRSLTAFDAATSLQHLPLTKQSQRESTKDTRISTARCDAVGMRADSGACLEFEVPRRSSIYFISQCEAPSLDHLD
jgi:hypothetical protein